MMSRRWNRWELEAKKAALLPGYAGAKGRYRYPRRKTSVRNLTCTLLEVAPLSLKITTGQWLETIDRVTGETLRRTVTHSLPRSQIAIAGIDVRSDTAALQDRVGTEVTLMVREWLLEDRGLL